MTGENRVIRRAVPLDCDALCDLYYEFHEFHVRGVPDRLRSLGQKDQQDWSRLRNDLVRIMQDDGASIFVAEISGEIIGLIEVYIRQDEAGNSLIIPHRYGFIQSLIVRENHRRCGTGKMLLSAAQEWAKAEGAEEMRLEAWEFADGPLGFYGKSGYLTKKRMLSKKFTE